MAESKPCVTGLIPMAQSAEVRRSVDFYKLLGMEIRGSLRNPFGLLQWVHVACEQAELMLTRAAHPIVGDQQAVLFYLYSPDLVGLREHLVPSCRAERSRRRQFSATIWKSSSRFREFLPIW